MPHEQDTKRVTPRRPDWCTKCSHERPTAPPEALPKAVAGSGLCASCGRKEKDLRERLRAEKAGALTAPKRYTNRRGPAGSAAA